MINTITRGDARDLARSIPDNSIDLVFTDPPYLKEYIPLYGWLAQESKRVLKPGGFLIAYVGNYWKYDTMLQLGQHLSFFFDYVTLMPGDNSILWPRRTICRHKSIMAFVKGEGKPRCNVLSVWTATGADKRYHAWGQEERTARYFIDCFSFPGDVVWEPFCGGGTTAIACKLIGRQFIAFEIEQKSVDIANARLQSIYQPYLLDSQVEQLSLEETA